MLAHSSTRAHAHAHAREWGRRGEHEPTLPAYRRTTSPSPPSAPRGPRCTRLQHLNVGHGGESGRATRPCDRLHACRATHRAHACQRRYLNSRPGSCCSSAPQDRRRAWRRTPVRLRCARRTSGAVSFRVARGKEEICTRCEGWMGGGTSLLLALPEAAREGHYGR